MTGGLMPVESHFYALSLAQAHSAMVTLDLQNSLVHHDFYNKAMRLKIAL